jgi:hypothetical protein
LKLAQPEGFEKDESFHGFGQRDTQSSVVAVKIPGPFSQVSAGFTAENLRARGWTLKSKEAIKIDDLSGYLIHFQQPAAGVEFLKWAVVFGDENKSFLVTATFPESQEAALSKKLKSAVLSVRLADGEESPPGADLNFTITTSPKLKLATQVGKNLLYTKNGKIPAESPTDPMYVVGRSLGPVSVADKREFVDRRLRQTANTQIKKIESTKAVRVGGLAGYESLADAADEKSGVPLRLYQVILFSDDAYYLMQGLVGAEHAETWLPEFETMAKSFKLRKP